MSNKLTGYFMAAALMMIWGGIGQMAYISDANMARLNNLMVMPVVKDAGIWGFVATWAGFGADWLRSAWELFWMQFGLYQGEFSIFFVIFWLPVAIGLIWGFIALLRGTSA